MTTLKEKKHLKEQITERTFLDIMGDSIKWLRSYGNPLRERYKCTHVFYRGNLKITLFDKPVDGTTVHTLCEDTEADLYHRYSHIKVPFVDIDQKNRKHLYSITPKHFRDMVVDLGVHGHRPKTFIQEGFVNNIYFTITMLPDFLDSRPN